MNNRYISAICGGVFMLACGSAFAADMPIKAPPPAIVATTWTGFYLGGNLGYGWGRANTDIDGNGSLLFSNVPNTIAFAGSQTQRPSGVIGGGQAGYNHQFSSTGVVLGLEVDIQGSGERGSNTFVAPFSKTICSDFICAGTAPFDGSTVTSYETKIEWFGTVRGRLGIVAGDQLLIYATGGLAYGRVSVSGTHNVTASAPPFVNTPSEFGPGTTAFGQAKTNTGFTVGGGLEGRLASRPFPNWTWKLEYLYLDLGSLDTSTAFSAATSNPFVFSALAGTVTTHTRFTDNIVRVGLNYQFH